MGALPWNLALRWARAGIMGVCPGVCVCVGVNGCAWVCLGVLVWAEWDGMGD